MSHRSGGLIQRRVHGTARHRAHGLPALRPAGAWPCGGTAGRAPWPAHGPGRRHGARGLHHGRGADRSRRPRRHGVRPAPGTRVTEPRAPAAVSPPGRAGCLPRRSPRAAADDRGAAGGSAPRPGFCRSRPVLGVLHWASRLHSHRMSSPRRGGTIEALAEQWNGQAWAVQSPPTPCRADGGAGRSTPGVLHVASRLRGRGLLLQRDRARPARRKLERPPVDGAAGRRATPQRPAVPHLLRLAPGLHGGGHAPGRWHAGRHWNGTTSAAQATPSRGALMGSPAHEPSLHGHRVHARPREPG